MVLNIHIESLKIIVRLNTRKTEEKNISKLRESLEMKRRDSPKGEERRLKR
jgi:hypothetical protein